jgi:cell division protein FtsL
MFQLTQIKLLSLIAALLLSILGIVTYEHHQAETERQHIAAERKAKEDFEKELLRRAQHPENSQWTGAAEFLRTH